MNFFARAWRYITRRKTKTILLMITFFVIGNLVILGLGISTAAENAKTLTRQQMRAAISYEVDYDAYYNWIYTLNDEDEINDAYSNRPTLDLEMGQKLAADERVIAYNYTTTNIMYADGFDALKVGNEDENNTIYTSYDDAGNEVTYREPDINLLAYDGATLIEMQEGTYTIVSGRFPDQSDEESGRMVVAITDQLAEENGLRVGDTIRLTQVAGYELTNIRESGADIDENNFYMDLEIVGIYNNLNEVNPNSDNWRWMSKYENPQNIVMTTLAAYEEYYRSYYREIIKYYRTLGWYDDSEVENFEEQVADILRPSRIVYLLNDPLEIDDFKEDYEDQLGSTYVKLDANDATFRRLARPLDTLSFFANIIVGIVIANAVIIISLITALSLKTREYEIGVLLSIGVSKAKIVAQLFLELMLIAILGFGLASVSGSLLAGQVGDAVLSYQTNTEAQYEDDSDDDSWYWSSEEDYFTEVDQDEMLSQYEVHISPLLIGEIYLIGTAVVFVSILVPSFMIMRLNPKQILLEKN